MKEQRMQQIKLPKLVTYVIINLLINFAEESNSTTFHHTVAYPCVRF